MKYLRMFEAASGLFPKRIKVTLIDAATGNSLGKYKIPAEMLPTAFNRPITLEIDNINWRVLQANPVLADDFLFAKKLTLQVQNTDSMETGQLHFNLPTICRNLPATGTEGLFQDCMIELEELGWRQLEFVPLNKFSLVEDAIKAIEAILTGQSNPLLGYEQQYIREGDLFTGLGISWPKFNSLLSNPVFGNISFNKNGYVLNGFAIKSESYTYYGILENDTIHTLCLTEFEWADDEFMKILSTFDLSLIDWCNASRVSAEAGEEPKSEYIKI